MFGVLQDKVLDLALVEVEGDPALGLVEAHWHLSPLSALGVRGGPTDTHSLKFFVSIRPSDAVCSEVALPRECTAGNRSGDH
jgi:hypothetical protein